MIYAKKSLGQHFLKSEKALRTIIDSAKIIPEEMILEIGPGQGGLTEKLLAAEARVLGIEKDDGLFAFLQQKFAGEIVIRKLKLIHEDILDWDLGQINEPYKLVANIPYNITGAILEKFLSSPHQPLQMVLLVQKEVAERIVARDDKESILSLSVKAYGQPHYIEKVLAGSFVPAPQVDSAIISIENINKDFFNEFSEAEFFKILKAGFQSKRKKLLSNLSSLYPKKLVAQVFQKLNLDENLRAEDLPKEGWGKLTSILHNERGESLL